MKTKITVLFIMFLSLVISSSVFAEGYLVTSDLWIRAVINTVEKGPIEAVWQKGGEDTTSRGDHVIWGHFYASPSDVTWGSENNPDLFVKIWFDVSGRVDVNFFHVSVPDIEVYSDYPYDGTWDQHGTTTMDYRYIRHEYQEIPEPEPSYGYTKCCFCECSGYECNARSFYLRNYSTVEDRDCSSLCDEQCCQTHSGTPLHWDHWPDQCSCTGSGSEIDCDSLDWD